MGVVHGGTESTRSCCVITVLISVEAIYLTYLEFRHLSTNFALYIHFTSS